VFVAARKIYDVFPNEQGGWRVERVGGPEITARFATEEEAIRETQRFAEAHPPSLVRIHDREGRVTAECEYD
jgi:hypothetical protein